MHSWLLMLLFAALMIPKVVNHVTVWDVYSKDVIAHVL